MGRFWLPGEIGKPAALDPIGYVPVCMDDEGSGKGREGGAAITRIANGVSRSEPDDDRGSGGRLCHPGGYWRMGDEAGGIASK